MTDTKQNQIAQSPINISWYSYPLLYQKIRGETIDVSALLTDYANLPLPPAVSVIEAAGAADKFFEKYGIGNSLVDIERPLEIFHGYEILMGQLLGHDKPRFKQIHKGTPLYFLGWTAFQTENYSKSIYYFEQAISEDIRKSETTDIAVLKQIPAINSFLLDPQNQSGVIVAVTLRTEMDAVLNMFSQRSGLSMNATDFTEKFIIGSGKFLDGEFRTIIACIYSFVLEHKTLVNALEFRSINGGSLEPFYIHLFKGGLILESILKLKCPQDRDTLGKAHTYLQTKLDTDRRKFVAGTFDNVINNVNALKAASENYQNICFAAAYGIRNTTGHNLIWTDSFGQDSTIYQDLYQATLGAIFWSIYKLWINP